MYHGNNTFPATVVTLYCAVVFVAMFEPSVFVATKMTNFRSQTDTSKTLRYVISENVENGTEVADILSDSALRSKYSPYIIEQLEFRFVTSAPAGASLSIELKSGVIRTAGHVDREAIASCRDKDVCILPLDVTVSPSVYFTIIKLAIEITDVNDNAPHFRQASYIIDIRESTSAGSSFLLPTAYDNDSRLYGVRRYQFDPDSEVHHLALSVMSRADGSLEPKLTLRHQLDREMESEYRLRLWAIDGGYPSLTAVTDIIVNVLDSNDHSPVFERTVYSVNISEDIAVGTLVVRTRVRRLIVFSLTIQCS